MWGGAWGSTYKNRPSQDKYKSPKQSVNRLLGS